MTTKEFELLRWITRSGLLLIGKSDPDVKIGRNLAKQGLVDKLEDGAAMVAFFRNKTGMAAIATLPGTSTEAGRE